MHCTIELDQVPLSFGDALEPIEQHLSRRILRVIELDLVLVCAVLETKGLGAHVGDLQTGFDGMLKPPELFGQGEYLLSVGGRKLKLDRIVVVLGFLVGGLAVVQKDDGDVFRCAALEKLGIKEARFSQGDGRREQEQCGNARFFHRAAFKRSSADAWVAWQMATAMASQAYSDSISSRRPSRECTIIFTCCFSARP